ncbi:prohibitin [Gracilaria domingensis]|nr:prohibitin [Gracilaria domingensis]
MSGGGSTQVLANALGRLARYSVAIGVLGGVAQSSLYVVNGGERAVIFNRFTGIEQHVRGEGMHFNIPWVQKPVIFDVRTRPRAISSVTGTNDLQMVNLTLRVLSKPTKDQLPTIYSRLGPDWDERVLPSIANEVLKAIVAQYNAEQLLTQREKVSRQIRETLTARAKQFHIELDDVSMTHLTFGREYASAIEAKQVTQQEAERSKYIVQVAEQEKIAAVVRAEGESTAAQMISDAMAKSGDGLLQLRRIEAAKEIASTLSRSRNIVYLPKGSNVLLNMG